jgi:pimeloyl-ACP methyl ester carboxylesterase
LKQHGLYWTHEWERPTTAVLDHFGCQDVTLLGISMGARLCICAAAFEPRIALALNFAGDLARCQGDYAQAQTAYPDAATRPGPAAGQPVGEVRRSRPIVSNKRRWYY